MFELKKQVRPNIWELEPYSCARDEFKGEASVYLDANENPFDLPFNRYPDPLQKNLKSEIKKIKGIKCRNTFLGNGSDEAIDLLYRIFCEPQKDNVVAITPTYGMYKVCADINNVEYRNVLLDENFQIKADALLERTDENTRIIWLCSPNNPTGNLLNPLEIEKILKNFSGIVVIDEAYIDFADSESWSKRLSEFPNMVILQTLSKAWGCAGLRLGIAYASEAIIGLFNKVKYPYNVNDSSQKIAAETLRQYGIFKERRDTIIDEREKLKSNLLNLPFVRHIYPSDANFILVKVDNANATYQYLVKDGIIVRNRNSVVLCENSLRITIGTPKENEILLDTLKKMPY